MSFAFGALHLMYVKVSAKPGYLLPEAPTLTSLALACWQWIISDVTCLKELLFHLWIREMLLLDMEFQTDNSSLQ